VREGEAPAAGWCTSGVPGSGNALGRGQQGAGEARVAWRYKLVHERLGSSARGTWRLGSRRWKKMAAEATVGYKFSSS
jgi:hypothetical protein